MMLSTSVCEYLGQTWIAHVEILEDDGLFYEVKITGREHSFHAIIGAHTNGVFLCIPAWQFGCELDSIHDLFFNRHIRDSFDPYFVETLSSAIRLLPPIRKDSKLYFDEETN